VVIKKKIPRCLQLAPPTSAATPRRHASNTKNSFHASCAPHAPATHRLGGAPAARSSEAASASTASAAPIHSATCISTSSQLARLKKLKRYAGGKCAAVPAPRGGTHASKFLSGGDLFRLKISCKIRKYERRETKRIISTVMDALNCAEALQKVHGGWTGAVGPAPSAPGRRHPVRTRQPAPRLAHLPGRPAQRTAQRPPSRPRGTAAAEPKPAIKTSQV
jgi:hypothetical protein